MQPEPLIEAPAVALRIDNLDTDQIMPKQFLRGIGKDGLARGVLYDLRFDALGKPRPECVLNQAPATQARILIGGANFGCGSSREHAVWGLQQFGIRAVIASSFGEIFYSNAMGNRLLLVQLPTAQVEQLMTLAERNDAPTVHIDVARQELRMGNLGPWGFAMSQRHQQMFLQGLDVIGLSLTYRTEIEAFALKRWSREPWLRNIALRMHERASA
jgi:3-isopropylmalate/(R)-2-methylmalate dehydratase small subunit